MQGEASVYTSEPPLPSIALSCPKLSGRPKNLLANMPLRLQGRPAMSLFPARKFLEGVCDIDNDYNSSFTAGFHGYGPNLDRYNPGGPYSYSGHSTDISPELPPALSSNHTNSGSNFPDYNNQLQNQHPNFQAASSTAHQAVSSKSASSSDSQKKVPPKRKSDPSLSHKRGNSGMNSQWSGGNADTSHGGTYQPQQAPREHSGGSSYSSRGHEDNILPMGPTEQLGTLQYLDSNSNPTGPTVDIKIASLVHKNFFFENHFWTCYRRNYMACNTSYSITPYLPGVHLAYKHSQESEAVPILGFAMFISAVVADHPHQVIPLLQHTPKRDKGPIGNPTKQLMGPRNRHSQGTPPHMGITDGIQPNGQIYSDIYGVSASQGSLPTEHNFDRLQFKTATANNGERRAGQQRYQLRLEVWGDTGGIDESSRWKRIAVSYSVDVVVRGRSPGHYLKDRRRGSSGSGGGSSQGNMYPNSGSGGGDYGPANVVGGQPNSYMPPAQYDNRGGNQYFNGAAGHHSRQDMAAYPIDPKPYDTTRMFPSAFTNPQPVYGDPGLYHHGLHQHQQHHQQPTGVSPQEIYGKPRDLDMGVLPRPEPQLRMGHDARCNVSATAGGAPSILPPLMSTMVNPGSYLSNS